MNVYRLLILFVLLLSGCGSTMEKLDQLDQLEAHERQKEKSERAHQELDYEVQKLKSE